MLLAHHTGASGMQLIVGPTTLVNLRRWRFCDVVTRVGPWKNVLIYYDVLLLCVCVCVHLYNYFNILYKFYK